MSKRAWYRCNPRKAQALLNQGHKVRLENGIWYYKRRIKQAAATRSASPPSGP